MLMTVRVYLLWYTWFVVVPACDHKDRFVERPPRNRTKHRVDMVDLVKYYDVFPVLPVIEERGRKREYTFRSREYFR